jgi:hypothetical protein
MSAREVGMYRSASRLALWASVLFVAEAAASTVGALLNAYQLALLDIVHFGGTIPNTLIETQDTRQFVITAFEFGIELIALILFFLWLYRISRNSWSFGIEDLYTPGWSIGWFFIPFAGLVLPYNVVHVLWQANSVSAGKQWQQAKTSPLLGFWWASWIALAVTHYEPLKVILGQGRMTGLFQNPSEAFSWLVEHHLWGFFWGRLLFDIVSITASVLTVVLIIRLTNLQKHRKAAVDDMDASNLDCPMGTPFPDWR